MNITDSHPNALADAKPTEVSLIYFELFGLRGGRRTKLVPFDHTSGLATLDEIAEQAGLTAEVDYEIYANERRVDPQMEIRRLLKREVVRSDPRTPSGFKMVWHIKLRYPPAAALTWDPSSGTIVEVADAALVTAQGGPPAESEVEPAGDDWNGDWEDDSDDSKPARSAAWAVVIGFLSAAMFGVGLGIFSASVGATGQTPPSAAADPAEIPGEFPGEFTIAEVLATERIPVEPPAEISGPDPNEGPKGGGLVGTRARAAQSSAAVADLEAKLTRIEDLVEKSNSRAWRRRADSIGALALERALNSPNTRLCIAETTKPHPQPKVTLVPWVDVETERVIHIQAWVAPSRLARGDSKAEQRASDELELCFYPAKRAGESLGATITTLVPRTYDWTSTLRPARRTELPINP